MQKHGMNIPVAESMNSSADESLLKRLHQLANYLVFIVIIIASLVEFGWQFNIEPLKRPIPQLVAMNPASALSFILSGISFLLLTATTQSRQKLIISKILAALVLSIGLLRICSEIFVMKFSIDTILYHNKLQDDAFENVSNRMAPNTAVGFILTGISLILLNFKTQREKILAQIIAFIIALLGLLSVVGYLYKVKAFYGVLVYIPMAIHTATCFLLLSIAILFAKPDRGIMKELTTSFSGSTISRFLVPAAIIIPVSLGFLMLLASWNENIPSELGTVLLVIAIVIVFLLLSWFIIVSLNKKDKLKREVENALRQSEKQIQTIFNAAPDAVIVIDEEGKIIKWNPKAESLLGWKEDEVMGRLLSDTIIPDRFREVHKKGLKHFLKTGEGPLLGKIVETNALTKKGTELDVALNIAASPKIQNKHLFIGFLRDISEQKKSEEKFRALLEAAPDAMIIANEKGEIVLINQQTETLFGYSRNELIGKPVEILIPADFRSKHEGHRNQYFTEPKARAMGAGLELFAIRRDGTQFPVEVSLSPLQTEAGILVSASVRDITDRKMAEEKIKESEQMFSSLFHKGPVMNAITEVADGKFIEVNDAFAGFLGYKKEEIIGKTSIELNMLVKPEVRQQRIIDLQKNGFVRGAETQVFTKNGNIKWLSTNIDKINWKGKDYWLTAAIDISARKETEHLIQKQRQEVQDFIDSMSTLCAKVSTDGTLLMVNKIAIQASGLSVEELLGTNFLEGQWWTFDKNVHNRVKNAFEKACSGTAITFDENIFVFAQVLSINFSLIPILKTDGSVDYIVAEGRDITALKMTEAALTEKTNQLETLNRELESFTYSVSHDLRAPLRGIIGFTAILEEDYADKLDKEAKRITRVIKENSFKMGRLIDDLLAFSRMGKKEIIKTNVDTAKLVHELINEMFLQSNNKKIKWNIGYLHSVNADINTIRQVWINLISNAIKYSAKKSEPLIEVSSFAREKEIVFYVKDNGVGFDESYKHKLFKVFQRLHSAEEFEGTGVGLALVEKIVSRHGGKVWAEGKTDEGACFYFSLPA